MKCQYPGGCEAEGRLYEFTNPFGERVRYRFCDEHKAWSQDPKVHAGAKVAWESTGTTLSPVALRLSETQPPADRA